MRRAPRELVELWREPKLSVTQTRMLAMIALGTPNKAMASELDLPFNRIRDEVQLLLDVFGCNNREHMVGQAFRYGILIWDDQGRIGVRRAKNG